MSLGVVAPLARPLSTPKAPTGFTVSPRADLYSELPNLVGHTLIVGTTRVGKTRCSIY
jgi:hypothetical protein